MIEPLWGLNPVVISNREKHIVMGAVSMGLDFIDNDSRAAMIRDVYEGG